MNRTGPLLAAIKTKRVHVSWLLAWSSLGLLLGIVLIRFIHPGPYRHVDWLILIITLFMLAYMRRSVLSVILACLAGMSLGLYAGAHTLQSFAQFNPYYDTVSVVSGKIRDDVVANSSEQRLRLTDITINGQALDGYVWASTPDKAALQRGDRITIQGTVLEGFGTVQASVFRAELLDVVRLQPGDVALLARTSFSEKVKAFLAEPQASLGISFLAGQRTALPDETQTRFRELGLVHLVVASGFHLSIVIRFGRRLFAKHSKYLATTTCFIMIGSFLLLTGFSTSMVRASLVAGLSLLAWYVGRAIHPIVLLLVVAAITALLNPAFVWNDLAWHLSFAAFTGVIVLAPLLQKYFWHPAKEPGFIRYLVVATASAQLMTFPIIALAFEQYSPLALLANLLVLPLIPLVMLGTFLVGLTGYVAPWIATLISAPTQLGLNYVTFLTGYLASLPWAVGEISISTNVVIGSYISLFALMVYLQKITGHSLRTENPIE